MKKIKEILKENKYFIMVLILTVIIFNYKLPYYVLNDGGVIDISDKIITDNKTNGSLNLLYVGQVDATIPIYLMAKFNSKWDLYSNEDRQVSNETISEVEKRDKILLDNSISNAIYVAYKSANKELNITSSTIYVIGVLEESNCNLKIGDEILTINNQLVTNPTLKEYISQSDTLTFGFKRDNTKLEEKCHTKVIKGEKMAGIMYAQNNTYDHSLKLNFSKRESGSSGGMMLTLSIYNALIDEDIIKGRNIAGTGTIDLEGNVGEIAGVKYKIIGAVKNNMDLVFVPKDNYEEAIKIKKKYNYDLKIIGVTKFEEVVNYLKAN